MCILGLGAGEVPILFLWGAGIFLTRLYVRMSQLDIGFLGFCEVPPPACFFGRVGFLFSALFLALLPARLVGETTLAV